MSYPIESHSPIECMLFLSDVKRNLASIICTACLPVVSTGTLCSRIVHPFLRNHFFMTPYTLTKAQLQNDLYKAYFEARKHKRSKPYQIRFEKGLEENISALCEELWSRTYKPMPSQCFIISDPKKREVFAADFRDRIVHHLYIIPKLRYFLLNQLGLYLHEGKLAICNVRQGVGFLGAYIKPGRKYIHNSCIQRMRNKIAVLETVENPVHLQSTINSFLGMLSHYRTKRMQQTLFYPINNVWKFGFYLKTKDKLKYVLATSYCGDEKL